MNKIFFRRQAFIAGTIFITAVLLGLLVNRCRPDPLPLVQDWKKTLALRMERQFPGEIAIIDLPRMSQLYKDKDVLVLDARPQDFFLLERIPGARSLPLEEADRLLPDLLKNLSPGTHIITYCEDSTCEAGLGLGKKLVQAGHLDVAVFLGGMAKWQTENMPVAGGEES